MSSNRPSTRACRDLAVSTTLALETIPLMSSVGPSSKSKSPGGCSLDHAAWIWRSSGARRWRCRVESAIRWNSARVSHSLHLPTRHKDKADSQKSNQQDLFLRQETPPVELCYSKGTTPVRCSDPTRSLVASKAGIYVLHSTTSPCCPAGPSSHHHP